MSLAMVLKVFSDCCICFAVLGSGPVQFEVPLLIPAVLCAAAAGMAAFFEEKGWGLLRRLCAALPFGSLLLGSGGSQVLLLAVPAAYTAIVILRNKLELEYYAYRRFFQHSLILLGGVYLLVNIWLFLLQITNDTLPALSPGVILRYGLVHLLCGIILQRQLRLGVGSNAAGGKRQMASMLGVVGAMIFGFVVAEPLLRKGIGTVLRALMSLLLMPVVFVVEMVVNWIASLQSTEKDKESWEAFLDHLESEGLAIGGNAQQQPQQSTEGGMDLSWLWVVFIVIFLLAAAILLLRSFHKRRSDGGMAEEVSRVVTAPKRRRSSGLSNRGRVRQAYRDFLRREKDLGMKLRISDTSGDVLDRIHKDTNRDGAENLRQVYLAARYDDRRKVGRSQVEQARRALKATRIKN